MGTNDFSFEDAARFTYALEWNVLYIEDDEDITRLFRHHVNNLVKKLDIAYSGKHGLGLIAENEYELVIVDLSLPDHNGIELAKKIRANNPDQHIMLVSGQSDSALLLEAISLGVSGFILKPFDKAQLFAALFTTFDRIQNAKMVNYYQQHLQSQIEKQTQEVFIKNKELEFHYSTDSVTGLLNKVKFTETVKTYQRDAALLMINLDNFFEINQGYGLDVGDDVLRAVAIFLAENTPPSAFVYRLQADEFLVFITDISDPEAEERIAKSIIRNLPRTPINVSDLAIKVSATIGVARGKPTELFNHSNLALIEARKKGKNRYQLYSDELKIEHTQKENLVWITRLKQALEEDNLVPYFQPIYDNEKKQAVKYECLIRMRHNDEIISPFYFLDAAKIAGLLPSITGLVVEKSLPLMVGNDIELSINITDQDFKGAYLVDYLSRKTEELGIAPGRITLEILEDIEPYLSESRSEQIVALKEKGFKIALDDFGVSCSNLGRISQYKPDFIKIDGSFIKNIDNSQSFRITELIANLAKSLQAKVVAEFVSSEEILHKVNALGIEFSQGYYFGKPEPAIKVT